MREEFKRLTKEQAELFLKEAKTASEFSRLCGVYSISGETLKDVRETIRNLGLDVDALDCKKRYLKNPKKCKLCDNVIPFKKRGNNFCNSSCSATYTNSRRTVSDEQKRKVSYTLKEKHKNGEIKRTYYKRKSKYPLKKICSYCGKDFLAKTWRDIYKKTCSKECAIKAGTKRTYRNGSRKTYYYENKIQGKVVLESSWEVRVAKELDRLNINWIRPKPLSWTNEQGSNKVYYPDFYLLDYDVYLDPKNPYCMDLDKEKMLYFSNKINIVYGDLEKLFEYINEHLLG